MSAVVGSDLDHGNNLQRPNCKKTEVDGRTSAGESDIQEELGRCPARHVQVQMRAMHVQVM
jgi:hypothetical protein